MARAYLGLGSNLGDRAGRLAAAVDALADLEGVAVTRASSLYETEPIGVGEQPWFLNLVAEIETRLDPNALLAEAKRLEQRLGREPSGRWGPRVIDVDILLYDGQRLVTRTLTIPHPELWNRLFVLRPLQELRPDLVAPDGRAISAVSAALAKQQTVRLLGPGPMPRPA